MKNTIIKFDIQLNKLKVIMAEAALQANPAQYLFEKDARSILFQLEALARIYNQVYDKKFLKKLLKNTKKAEDLLGQIDFYNSLCTQFKASSKIPLEINKYFAEMLDVQYKNANLYFENKNWLNGKRIYKLEKKLSNTNWQNINKENKNIQKFIEKEIVKISNFIDECKFTSIENELHELRRDIRWVSIYAQCLNGMVVLKASKTSNEYKQYLTPEITKSPFNKLPICKDEFTPIYFDKNSFFAISWLIKELGILKDQGLAQEALKQAINEVSKTKVENNLPSDLQKYFGNTIISETEILAKAKTIVADFNKLGILNNLIIKQ